ncbi:MAG: 2,3-bisphosphoglycerate-independent phosphoglycerate mutase [Methanocellales archaeon]|nr:2,3-bisphosphoglycerate-independent phosphoglycerate mutase [Methanocellales archaeon]MDD4898251.1 2,3-bisphosphoglycerate-independent phosphoglycerate mutase [Methanocellales archaeon]MDD5447032.1 2,3-bisphosphoglycerate-independent phosphoglycerate mutase [Methanocellales archaeon]
MGIAKKILLIVLDGVSDRPINGKTPLQMAKKPNLDSMASLGINGIMDPIAPGVRPGSDVAHLALLGYDPYKVYTGRGPFEAAGVGIHLKKGDVAFRCNFATRKDGIVIDRRAGRISNTTELSKAIQEGVNLDTEFIFKRSTGHRAAMALRGDGLSSHVTASDPKHDVGPIRRVDALGPEAERTANLLNEFIEQAEKVLEDHPTNIERKRSGKLPANTILIRGAGTVQKTETFSEKYGLKGAVIAATGLIIGIGRMYGLDYIETKGATGGVDSDVSAKVKNAINALNDHDFVLLNIKGADESGHDGLIEKKTQFIGKVDKALESITCLKDTLVVVTADHSTPIEVRNHSADPVPVMIKGPGIRVDDVRTYDEISAATGGLNRIHSMDLMPILMDLIDHTKKFGA